MRRVGATPSWGRDVELAALSRALDQATAGDIAVALVAGEPGIGKSRLVDAVAADARGRGVRVLWAEARDEQHAPLRLWAPIERALGATAPGAGPDLPASERRWELLDALVSRGLDQLARLLAVPPGREVAATELAGMDAAPVPVARDLGAALDARAKREYRRRITELQDDIDEADAHHDPERAARARLELDALVQELRRAVSLDGSDRPTGSGAERARVNVTRSLKRAIATIAAELPTLGAHLDNAVRTGRTCTYTPEPATTLTWHVSR